MVGALETRHEPGRDELVALDSMAVTLPKTQRHNLKKYNNKTVGGGVLWAYMIESAKGTCPVKILRVLQGAMDETDETVKKVKEANQDLQDAMVLDLNFYVNIIHALHISLMMLYV